MQLTQVWCFLEGTSVTADAEALQVTASAGGMTLKSAKAMSLKTTANNTAIHITPHGAGQVNIGTDAQTPIDLSGAGITLDASSTISLESSGGAINIGSENDAQAISIGTGAAARTITMGNITGATALALNAGTGGITLTSTGTGDITLDSDDVMNLDSDGALNIDSSAGAINIGVDAVAGAINVGTGASARTITVGNDSSTKVDVNASAIELDAGGSGFTIDGAAASSMTTSADALTISGKTGLNLQEDGTSVIAIDTDRNVLFSETNGTTG